MKMICRADSSILHTKGIVHWLNTTCSVLINDHSSLHMCVYIQGWFWQVDTGQAIQYGQAHLVWYSHPGQKFQRLAMPD